MANEQFWLYRVALRRNVTIEHGYRNETIEEIAQITQAELGNSGAIRYLNTWESPGSISLAAHPRSLAAVQGIVRERVVMGSACANRDETVFPHGDDCTIKGTFVLEIDSGTDGPAVASE